MTPATRHVAAGGINIGVPAVLNSSVLRLAEPFSLLNCMECFIFSYLRYPSGADLTSRVFFGVAWRDVVWLSCRKMTMTMRAHAVVSWLVGALIYVETHRRRAVDTTSAKFC